MSDSYGRVALLVLNYNSQRFLKGCLESLLGQTWPNFQIILIDNHSTDGSVDFVREEFPQVQVLANPENYGFSKGFNEGIRRVASEFDYIGLLNPDIRADPRWLEESVALMCAKPQVQICSSLVLDWTGELVDNAGGIIINLPAGILGGLLTRTRVSEIPVQYRDQPFPVFFGLINAIVVQAQVFHRIGLFDETYFMEFADVDLSWRLLVNGGQVWCNPKAIAYHYGGGAAKDRQLSLHILGQTETHILASFFKNLSWQNLVLIFPQLLFVRISASLIYLVISPRVTFRKLHGILGFFLMLPHYARQRMACQRLRAVNDRIVFSFNPVPLFSVRPLVEVFPLWLAHVARAYAKRGSQWEPK